MKFSEYDNAIKQFVCYEDVDYPFYGLMSEVGELMELPARLLRGDNIDMTPEEFKIHQQKELGDILFNLNELCKYYRTTLEEVAQLNIEKLTKRKEDGTIKGVGNDR